jgi:penicillin-binding protein 2
MAKLTTSTLQQSFDRRTFVLGAIQGGIGLLLAARMGYIAVAENEKYEMEAESNRVNLSLIPPRRGWILDRNGKPLASNRADFRVDVIPVRLQDPTREVAQLGELLQMKPDQVADLETRIAGAARFQAVPVASGLDYDQFAAVSVRLPELPGVVPQRGYSRYYPTGPAVGHLLGYVGAANKEEYDKEPIPLLVTPGFKLGKAGLEKEYEKVLRGEPGARRTEVTASGRIVRDLETREDVQGQSIKLTVDGSLQEFASRRIGLQSAAVVVIDCKTGGILTLASMPCFDPNTFANGIGRIQWKMLNEDDHIPLLNKAVRGLYPPGSTVKPMASLALQINGVSPDEKVNCPGGYQLGNRFFRCDARHGPLDMRGAIEHSCNTYFWSMVHRIGYENVAPVARKLGLGQEYDLPGINQRYGTVPDPEWKMRRYHQEWTAADGLNAAIGQGYVLVSPLQLAVMTARIASGRDLVPSMLFGQPKPPGPALPFTPEQLAVTRDGMFRVVNGHGTGAGSRLPVEGITMSGKTGTAQVRRLVSRGGGGAWAGRDHSWFVCFAPSEAPRYAMAVLVEHGGFGASAAAPIAKDVMTCLFEPDKAWAALLEMEKTWGGPPAERMAAKYAAYAAKYGASAPKVGSDVSVEAAEQGSENPATPPQTTGVITGTERGEAGAAARGEATPAPEPNATPPAAAGANRSGAR